MEENKKKRIFFPFVEAGLGHIMPMRAVLDAFSKKYSDRCEIVEEKFFQMGDNEGLKLVEKKLVKEVHKHQKSKIHGFFQFLLMAMFGTKNSLSFLHKVHWKHGYQPAIKIMQEVNADLIFNTHFSTIFYACDAKERGLIKSKIAAYCPDPVVDRQWDRRLDLIALSNEHGAEKAKKVRGFIKQKTEIHLTPFLIRQQIKEFTKPREEYKKELGLDPSRFTILLADGAYGVGKLKKTVYQLLKSECTPLNIIAVCGKNEKLYQEFLTIEANNSIIFKPYGFTDKMLLLSAACDLFIGKAGASNLAEPTYFGAPSIITFTATPIEKWIAKHYTDYVKSSVKITSVKKAVSLALEWAADKSKMSQYIENSISARRTDGPDILADILWEMLNKP